MDTSFRGISMAVALSTMKSNTLPGWGVGLGVFDGWGGVLVGGEEFWWVGRSFGGFGGCGEVLGVFSEWVLGIFNGWVLGILSGLRVR